MQIHFCDLCNESVPESDLEQGRAFLRKGRVVCASCDAAMSANEAAARASVVAEPAPAPLSAPLNAPVATPAHPHAAHQPHHHIHVQRTSGSSGLIVALVAVLFVFALGYWAVDQLTGVERRLGAIEGSIADAKSELKSSRDRQDRTQADMTAALEKRASELSVAVDARATKSDGEARAALAQISEKVAAFQTQVEELRRSFGQVGRHDADIAALEKRCSGIADELAALGVRIDVLASAPAPSMEVSDEVAGGAHKTDQQPAWYALVEQLSSKRTSERWNAMTALAETRDVAVVPHLLPCLKDEDVFNRMAAARILGDLGSLTAVPSLIDALADSNASVRDASYLALRQLTKRDFPFDAHSDDENERAKRIKAWEDWWKKEKPQGS